ncbi:PD-(D/E)XK nuclease family protein [Chengkuizengella axinellae]|uniref:PD-(D/E)XK nuclease family protein n=1 Tax=Chengkuizengella axinellae TaxID=3064388 RepID=A0ABT9IZA2_9BACL|nr:PD-(D/E)XK nuclease family protein [Chengkuizengella sp. 2205SS18-9]MDP5274701.1 PD-(D/E)XK nuclease family protein [Chengkuizengella sp. 2205SS18-9]
MAFEIRPYPEWSWSQSRDQIFKDCQRKYYYHYYGSHNGWLRDASEDQRTMYRLKQITNLYMILGDGIHLMAEASLKQWQLEKSLPDQKEITEDVRFHLNQAYKDSQDIMRWKVAPKKLKMLHELYYGDELPPKRVAQIKERLNLCITHYFESETVQDMMNCDEIEIKEIEELNTFFIQDQKIYVKLDLLYKKQDKWIIADWKTGNESEQNDNQLLLYALFLHDKYNVPFEQMEIRLEYLLSGQSKTISIDEDELNQLKVDIVESMDQMKQLLEDAAINKPKPMSSFPTNPSKLNCWGCNYRECCEEITLQKREA